MNKPNDNTKMKITHILFDFDGTLVNTIDTIVNIVERIVTERNRQMTNEIRGKFQSKKKKMCTIL